MVDVHRQTVTHQGRPYEASASLNNCAGVWTAVLRAEDGSLAGSGAGYSPEEAIRVAANLLAESHPPAPAPELPVPRR